MYPVSNNLLYQIPQNSSYINSVQNAAYNPVVPGVTPAISQQPAFDTVTISSKNSQEENKKLTKNQKLGIASGALLGVAALGLIIRGRLKAVTKLAEHIDFAPASTMEEAREFARQHLKIKKFDVADDLDMANWVNEGLVNINNKYKGRAYIPDEVVAFSKEESAKRSSTLASMAAYQGKDFRLHSQLRVNLGYFDNAKNNIQKMLDDFGFKKVPLDDGHSEVQMQILPFYNPDKLLDMMQISSKFMNNKATKMDIVALRQSLGDYYAYAHFLNNDPLKLLENVYAQKGAIDLLKTHMKPGSFKTIEELGKMTNKEQVNYAFDASSALSKKLAVDNMPYAKILDSKRSVFNTLFHEEGHLFHKKNTILDYEDMHVIYGDKKDKPVKIGELAKEFLENQDEQFVASKVSFYAKRSPLEFVAEVYSRMLGGHKFDDDVMRLYKKYKGPALPE